MKDKRFLVFYYYEYAEIGGLGDLKGSFDSIDECKDFLMSKKQLSFPKGFDYFDIYDRIEGLKIDIEL